MKKHNLFKTLAIFFLVLVLLSWIIPIGTSTSGTYVKGTTSPVGIFHLFRLPLLTIGTFLQYGLVFLGIGGLYGVLNRTGAYVPFVKRVANYWKGKETLFLALVIGGFALLASLTALSFPLFVLVPFFITVILVMEMRKTTALASTVGAILVGLIGSTYGFNVSGYINTYLELDVNNLIFTKIILLVMLVTLLILFVTKYARADLIVAKKKEEKEKKSEKKETKASKKKEEVIVKEEKEEAKIPFFQEKYQNKKSVVPMLVIILLAVIFSLVMMFNWYYGFKVTFFQDIYTSLMEIKIGDYPLVSNILGGLSQFGYWSYYELTVVLIISSLLIGWIYSLRFDEILDGFFKGAKKMVKVAFYASICSIFFAVILTNQSGNMFATITNYLLNLTKSFNVFITSILSFIGGFFYNDFYYLVGETRPLLATKYDAATLPVVGLALQSMYGLAMMIFPSSIILISGLSYLEVSYKEWIKYIWKFLLGILVIIMLVLIISTLFI